MGLLWRMATRNLTRRRTQTLVLVLGLMVSTGTIMASLAVADSLREGIRHAALAGYGPADEFVQVNGQVFFPQNATDKLAAAGIGAPSPVVIGQASLRDERTHARVAATGVEGFDAKSDAPYGPFTLGRSVSDGGDLGASDVYLRKDVAEQLGARVGDVINVSVAGVTDPTQYVTFDIGGNITGAGTCFDPSVLPPGVPRPPTQLPCAYSPDTPTSNQTFRVPIGRGALSLTVIAEPGGGENDPTKPDLDIVAVAPNGTQYVSATGAPTAPSDPAYLNIEPDPAHRYLSQGNWTVRVTAKNAANARWSGGMYVDYAVYDLASAQRPGAAIDVVNDPDGAFYIGASNQDTRHADLTVAGIVEPTGKGAFLGRTGVFLTLGAAQSLYGKTGMVNAIKVEDPHGATRAQLQPVLDELRAEDPDEPAFDHLAFAPVKQQALARAELESGYYRDFLTAVSSLTVLAGVLLATNVLILLAGERRRGIATARALGFTRGQVARAFTLEAGLLAALAAVGGVALGLVGAIGILLGFDYILRAVNPTVTGFSFSVTPQSILLAAALGFAVTLVTGAIVSWRVAGGSIALAQRGLGQGLGLGRRRVALPIVGIVAGALAFAAGFALPDGDAAFALRVLGPPLLLAGVIGLARKDTWRLPLALTLSLVSLVSLALDPGPRDAFARVVSLLRGGVLAAGLVLALFSWARAERLLERLGRGARPVHALLARYPLRARGRTGLTVAMMAFVMTILVFFSILGTTFALHLADETGGYDVLATAPAATTDIRTALASDSPLGDPVVNITSYDTLLQADAFGGALVTIDGAAPHYKGAPVDHVYSYQRSFADHERFTFAELDGQYKSGREAFLAVLSDPTLAIVGMGYTLDETGNPGAHHVGSTLVLHGANGDTKLRVVGVLKEYYLAGVWVHPVTLRTSFQQVGAAFLVHGRVGAPQLVQQLDAAGEKAGLDAQDLSAQASTALEENEQFLRMFQMFLGSGLLVGVASIVVVLARDVIDRRNDIGILRAIGYEREHVAGWLAGEGVLVALLGSLVGVVSGTLLALTVWATTIRPTMSVPFSWSYIVIPVILLLTLGAVLVAVLWPAWRAGSMLPAEAVRPLE